MSVTALQSHVELAGAGGPLCDKQQAYGYQQRNCSASALLADCTSAACQKAPQDLGGEKQGKGPMLGQRPPAVSVGSDLGDSTTGISDLLKQAGPQVVVLEQLMQKELAAIAGDEQTLNKIRSLASHHQQQASKTDTARQNAAKHRIVHVLPLLGQSLAQLLSLLQQRQQQEGGSAGLVQDYSALLQQLMASCTTPLSDAVASSSSSSNEFLAALASEVLRIKQFVAYCYDALQGETAQLGHHLPPVPVTSDETSEDPDSSTPDKLKAEGCDIAPAAPQGCSRTASKDGTRSAAAAHAELDPCSLSELQAKANSVCHALVQLGDFINNSYKKLAGLAQQFDTLLTAAATDASQSSTSQGEMQSGSSSRGSLLGLLAGRHQQQHSGGVLARSYTPTFDGSSSSGPLKCGVEFLLMTPGVCSHSSCNIHAQSYTAGVPPDIYHQTLHKLIVLGQGPEPIMWGLSVLYARLRHASTAADGAQQSKSPAAAAEWTAPDQFERNTTKYWVHPSNILRLKLALLQHLPLLVYGASDPVYAGDITKAALKANGSSITSLIGSVYFDSPELEVYHSRLSREDGARLVRVRYYGSRQPAAGDQQLFVERKTHHKRWTGERSIKERAPLSQSQLSPYLSGEVPPTELTSKESKQELLQQVLDYLKACNQIPAMRTEYMRTAWQRYDSNSVRLSLDEHMLLIREKQKMPTPGVTLSSPGGEEWCASLEHQAQLAAGDTVRFPYGILEIKLQEEEPKWIEELKASGVLVKSPKFSKFCHGMALLYPDRCMHSPNWFIWDDATCSASPATMEQLVEQHIANGNDPGGLQSADAFSPQLTTDSVSPGPTLTPLRIPRLEPSSCNQPPPTLHLTAANSGYPYASSHMQLTSQKTASTGAGSASDDIWHSEHCLTTGSCGHEAAVDTRCKLLWGAGLHTPSQPGTPTRMSGDMTAGVCFGSPLDRSSRDGVYISDPHGQNDSSAGYSRSKGGSGPFNAGINSSILPGYPMQESTLVPAGNCNSHHAANTSAGCVYSASPRSDTAALLPKSFSYSHADRQQQQGCRHGARSVGSRPLSYPCNEAGDILITGPDFSAATAAKAAAPGASSPTSSIVSSGSGIKRLLGMMVGRKGRVDSSIERQADCTVTDVINRQDTPPNHNVLFVTNPLEAQHLSGRPHQSHHHHHHHHHGSTTLSSCSTSSQETSTGSGGTARHCLTAHSTSSSQGLPSITDASPTAGAAAEAHWQLATAVSSKGSHQRDVVKCVADQSCSDTDHKGYQHLKTHSDATAGVPSMVMLQDETGWKDVSAGLCTDSAKGMHGAAMMYPQNYVIQVNHVRQEPSGYGALWPAGDGGNADGDAPAQHSSPKLMQQYLPPANGSHPQLPGAPAATTVAAGPGSKDSADYVVRVNGASGGGSSSNDSSGSYGGDGAKQGRGRGLLQKLRAAADRRRLKSRVFGAGKGGGGGGGGGGGNPSGKNEHLLGFAGIGPRSKTLVRARAEPKTFFANERTFLSWLQISVLVMMTGLGLLGGSTLMTNSLGPDASQPDCMQITVCRASRISGAVVAPASVVFMLYALYTFKKRTWQIRHQMTTVRYDDQLGPVLLTVLLVVVTVVSIVLGLKALLYA